ncbi:hypothetical protein RCCS2_01978 [Roseobacter sp. CCS2]|nr:hypothetical protein RCCS2_01978 [Roseobacter sp. CCS2]
MLQQGWGLILPDCSDASYETPTKALFLATIADFLTPP